MIAVPMTRQSLASWLRDIADHVETGDSMEGRVSWVLDYDKLESDDYDPATVLVEAFVRHGNLEGSGGVIIVGKQDV